MTIKNKTLLRALKKSKFSSDQLPEDLDSWKKFLDIIQRTGHAISNDETGISEDPDVRFEVAKKIVERAQDYGISPADVVVDPLVMPVGAINDAGKQVLRLISRLRNELKVNTTCGASNFSFGIPNRNGVNASFISMAMGAGMTSAIVNPLHSEVVQAVRAADVVMGNDPDCANWLANYREPAAEGARERGGRRRRAKA